MEQVVRREWETRIRCNQEGASSPFLERLEDANEQFEIDRFFTGRNSRLLRGAFRGNAPPQLLRRCVEVAFAAALAANEKRIYESAIPDLEKGIKLADDALEALDRLFNWMSLPQPASWRTKDRDKAAAAIFNSARQVTFLDDLSPSERADRAALSSRAMIDARSFVAQMPAAYRMHRDSMVSQNLGEVEKIEFVKVLAEGWFCFCGEVPPKAGKAFHDFVWNAWLDISSDHPDSAEETFTHAIRQVSEKMTAQHLPSDWKADWFW